MLNEITLFSAGYEQPSWSPQKSGMAFRAKELTTR
jgi:hypothetical protein